MNKILEKLYEYDIKMKIKKVKNEENIVEIIFKKGKYSSRLCIMIDKLNRDGGSERIILHHLNGFIDSLDWREKHELKTEK